jgi:hypothetical protein
VTAAASQAFSWALVLREEPTAAHLDVHRVAQASKLDRGAAARSRSSAGAHQHASASWLQHVPAVEVLRRVWDEQYRAEAGVLRWREVKEIPTPSEMISSPYDTDARYSSKRSVDCITIVYGNAGPTTCSNPRGRNPIAIVASADSSSVMR